MNSATPESEPLEVAEIVRRYGPELMETYGSVVTLAQRRVLRDIACCRTAALGGHLSECGQCGARQIAYNSCRNRHCPKCQASTRAEWMADRAKELLPVPYFHVVFTLPESISALALHNQRVIYGLLFEAASKTLLEVAAKEQNLGAQIGVLAVLHTWGQNLMFHPHLHCVVPGGGFSPDGTRWVACRPDFFLPVRILSRVFRGKFIALLRRSRQQGELEFHGGQRDLTNDSAFEAWLDRVVQTEWVVYAKPPFGGPEQVLKYLARYTHRVAISNQRLLSDAQGRVTFRWKDYADGSSIKTMSLTGVEFLRRFLLHVLPSGFVKIRYFGFLGNRHRAKRLEQARRLLGVPNPSPAPPETGYLPLTEEPSAITKSVCSSCGQGDLHCIAELPKMNLGLPLSVLLRLIPKSNCVVAVRTGSRSQRGASPPVTEFERSNTS